MAFRIEYGGAAIPFAGKAAYAYGGYQAKERRAARALQTRMQEKSIEARQESQVRAIAAQEDRDIEMANRRTQEIEQRARIGTEAAEHQFELREDFAERKMLLDQDQMEFALEQKKDLYDYEYTERDKRRLEEFKNHHNQIDDMVTTGQLTVEAGEEFHNQISLREAGIEKTKRKQWPEGRGVGQSWELGEVGSGLWVQRKPDGTMTKLFDTRQMEQAQLKEQAKRVSDSRKVLAKLQGERRKYVQGLEKETVKDPGSEKIVPRYSGGEIRRRAAAKFKDAIFEAQMDLVDAREGIAEEVPGGGLRPTETPFDIALTPEFSGAGEAGIGAQPQPTTSPYVTQPQALDPEAKAALGVQAAGARIPQTPEAIKRSPQDAIQAFRQLTPDLVQTLPPNAQRAYQLVQERMKRFMAQPGTGKIFGLQEMPFELRAMIAGIVAIAQGETNVRRPAIAQ